MDGVDGWFNGWMPLFFYIYYNHSLNKSLNILSSSSGPGSISGYCIFLFFCVHCFRHTFLMSLISGLSIDVSSIKRIHTEFTGDR